MKLAQIKPLDGFRLWLRYEDGAEGTVDLTALAGRGVFAAWQQPGVFAQARLIESRSVAWGDGLDLCADALYLRLTGKAPEEAFPACALPPLPEIARFYGVSIFVYFDDHAPPHFHARYGGDEAVFEITSLVVIEGRLPPRAHGLVVEWATQHQAEQHAAFQRAAALQPPGKIDPLP